MHPSSQAGSPGGTVTPAAKGGNPEGFGWKMLDYKFGDRPAYQVMKGMAKNHANGGGFCGTPATAPGGMASAAAMGSQPAAQNYDPVTPGPGAQDAGAPAVTPETEEAFL